MHTKPTTTDAAAALRKLCEELSADPKMRANWMRACREQGARAAGMTVRPRK